MSSENRGWYHDDLVMMFAWNVLLALASCDTRMQGNEEVLVIYFLVVNGMYLSKIFLSVLLRMLLYTWSKRNRINRELRRVRQWSKGFILDRRAFAICFKWFFALASAFALLLYATPEDGWGVMWIFFIILLCMYFVSLISLYQREVRKHREEEKKHLRSV